MKSILLLLLFVSCLCIGVIPPCQAQVTITASGPLALAPNGSVTLSGPGGYSSYQWTRNNADITGTQPSLVVTTPGYYRVQVSNGGSATVSTAVRVTVRQGAGSPDQNYNQEDVVLKEGVLTENDVDLAQTKKKRTITYTDGLLRPIQQVEVKASASNADVIQLYEYSAAGQQPRQYLPYTSGTDGLFKSNALASQQAFYSNSGPGKVARETGGLTYSESVFEDTPDGSVIEQGTPGTSGQILKDGNGNSTFQGHTKRTYTRTVGGGEVALWTYTPGAEGVIGTATQRIAPARSITITQLMDEDGKLSWKYTNMLGQLVAKEVLVSPGVYLTTAYAFDQLGRVTMIMSPEGVKRIVNSGGLLNSDFIARWAYLFNFDQRGRQISKKVPGKAWEYMVYDRWDRLVATQNGNQRKQGTWTFTKYDELNRPIITGQISSTRTQTQLTADIESAVASGSIIRYESQADNTTGPVRIGYTLNKSWPTSATGNDLRTVNYLDDYNFITSTQPTLSYQQEASTDLASPSQASILTNGFPTISQTRTLGSNNWLTAVSYYDDKGRIIQTKETNQLGNVDRVTTEYDFSGKIIKTYTAHNITASGPTHTIRYRYTYYDNDAPNELFAWFDKKDGTGEILLSKKEYNELSQLVDDKLGINPGNGKYFQSVDYRYNLKGQLSHLNNRDLLDGVATNDDLDAEPDLFGMELKYDTDLQTGSTSALYNGNISESLWKSRRDNKLRSFAYQYDNANRLINAKYAAWGAGWVDEKDDISINGSASGIGRFSVSDIQYDLNGNIRQMNRVGHRSNAAGGQAIFGPLDQLRYDYGSAGGNQLQSVADLAGYTSAPNDFEDGTAAGADYAYDDNGNLIKDLNKNLNIIYNELDLPSSIGVGYFQTISSIYSASGEKLGYSINRNGAITTDTYVNGFVYTTASGPALSVTTPVGRALYGTTADNTTPHWMQEFHIRDHLGNLRIAFRDEGQTPLQNATATMESVNAPKEEEKFDNLAATRQLDPDHSRTGSYAARLNAGQSQRMFGPSTSMQVHSGDSIYFEVYGRYDDTKKGAIWPVIIPLATTANNTPTLNDNVSSRTKGFLPRLSAGFTLVWTAIPQLFQRRAEVPRASVKYDFYDKDSTLVASEVKYLDRDAANSWQKLAVGLKAKQDGYVLVSVQNGSDEDVWFDDAALRTSTTELIVQENHYDPWGQNLVDIEVAGAPDCKQQYGNQDRIDVAGLEWIDHGARYYDAQLGRWHTPDPANQFSSPYVGMGNNPVMYTDPDGKFIFIPILIGAAIGAYLGHQVGKAAGANGWAMAGYVVGGALIGGLSGGLANGVASSGIPLAQTAGIFTGSFTSSFGMNMLSGGMTGVSIGLGVASYDFQQQEWGYIGKKNNSLLEDIGYGLGALSNISDAFTGLHPGNAQLQTEMDNSEGFDPIGHAQVVVDGKPTIDFGPATPHQGNYKIYGLGKKWNSGTNSWLKGETIQQEIEGNSLSPINVPGVNINAIRNYANRLNASPGIYNVPFSSCVTKAASALRTGGVMVVGIHPYLLYAEVYLRAAGFRPGVLSYFTRELK